MSNEMLFAPHELPPSQESLGVTLAGLALPVVATFSQTPNSVLKHLTEQLAKNPDINNILEQIAHNPVGDNVLMGVGFGFSGGLAGFIIGAASGPFMPEIRINLSRNSRMRVNQQPKPLGKKVFDNAFGFAAVGAFFGYIAGSRV